MRGLFALLILLVPLYVMAKSAPEFDPAADPAALAASFVKADKLKNLASVKRAAIAQFRVEFVVENDAKSSSSGTTGWTSVRSDIKLVGVTDEARQAIADQLYDKLVQDLATAGLEVIPYATVRESDGYKSLGPILHSKQEPVGTQAGKSIFVGARGMPYYFTNDDKHLGVAALLGGSIMIQPQNIEPQIAKSLEAAVFRVTLFVAFADQSKRGGMFTSRSAVKTSAGLAIVPDLSQFLIIAPDGKARVYLDETVFMDSDAVQMKETTTTGEKVSQGIANVITGLMAGGIRSVAHYEASTTPEAYTAVVIRYGLALEAAMMNALRPGLTVTPAPAPAPEAAPEAPAAEPPPAAEAAPAAGSAS